MVEGNSSVNFFDDSFSQKSESKSKNSRKEMKKEAEEASDKKKLKVVKQALIETRQAKEDLEKELNALKTRNRELEKENADTSNKYLRLYDENDKLQEVLQNLQYQLTSGTGAKVRPTQYNFLGRHQVRSELYYLKSRDKGHSVPSA